MSDFHAFDPIRLNGLWYATCACGWTSATGHPVMAQALPDWETHIDRHVLIIHHTGKDTPQ